ncbi:MAG: Glu-tRNA(Gln) amidotransferase subunit GatD [Candidatus Woesearchaeota archaeon]
MDLIIGSKYEFTLTDGYVRSGLLISFDSMSLFLKLSSGYNEGILIKNIKSSKILERPKSSQKKTSILESNPEILILHTGGTIASKVDYSTGAVNSLVTPEELLALYPELKNNARIGSELISNMPSDDLNFSHYNLMAKKIEESIKKYPKLKGIILTHGTDTMHYTSAALSFVLQNLPVPLILVGSQRSSDRPSSDAASNLLNAVFFINKHPEFREVMICMHSSINDPDAFILRGTNARKMHSSKRDAFKPINGGVLASVNFESKKIILSSEPLHKKSDFEVKLFNDKLKIGWIKSRPNMHPDEFVVYKNFDALILEGTGLGHFPITEFDSNTKNNALIFKNIKELSKLLILVMVTQTIFGRVNLNVYSPARKLKDLGVLGHNLALSPETAYIKLAWLLSNFKKDEVKKLYAEDFVGDVVSRIVGGLDE